MCFGQETEIQPQKLSFEIGGGYCYSQLKEFNQQLIIGGSSEDYNNELHSGFSLGLGATYHWNKAFSTSIVIQSNYYSISDEKVGLQFEDEPGGVNFNYNVRLKTTLRSMNVGISSTLYFDQIKPKSSHSLINYGIYLTGAYGAGRYQRDRTSYIWGQGDGNLSRIREIYSTWNVQYGMVVALNFKHPNIQAIIFKGGILHTVQSNFSAQKFSILQGPQEIALDFTGFQTSLALQFGFGK